MITCSVPDKFITDGLKVLGCVVGEVRAEEHVRLLELLDAAREVGPGAYLIHNSSHFPFNIT